ncbi:MAG TPA: serine/threonine-protein kinase [Anaeromyxobacteraceae bacterium]|nr:serine/threonine-protein kinase [Anaeromyxobacteraceae bacterium]
MGSSDLPDTQTACPKCGYLADPADGSVNYCPKCGTDLRPGAQNDRTLAHPWLDQVIADRYRLIDLLGEGGMGAVYKAEHIRMGKALALKILRGEFARDPGAVQRFKSEAQIVSRLSHPHTIAVFDFGEIAGGEGFYLAMEYVPGKDLATVLREEGRLPDVRASLIGQQVLGSLAEAHDAGIVHRDMKPANVMLMQTRSGEDFVKVLDFGIAKLRDEGPSASSTTGAGAIIGTPNYLSPEQARGEAPDARADLYSVGAVLYELVAGRPPFVAPNPLAVVSAHLHQEPARLTEVAPGVSARYAEVVHRALRKNPQERFASADEMREALSRLGETSGRVMRRRPSAPSVTGALQIASREDFREFERQLQALRRSRVVAPVIAAVLLAVVGLVTWRWSDVYALLVARAPQFASSLPAAFRPADLYDGLEHEPNDSPAQANPLPIPPGPDGRRWGGVATMRGHVGARISETSGDVDVYRIEVPPLPTRAVLVAEWSADGPREGIAGLDVALTLSREPAGDGDRTSAPLVANVDRGGPGRGETLSAALDPGTYTLAVRERHRPDAPPVERPENRYLLSVRLVEPRPGDEIEPNDTPDAVDHAVLRYPQWRAVAEQNPLAAASAVQATTSRDDADTFAVPLGGQAEVPEVVVAVPAPDLALTGQLWSPDQEDLAAGRTKDRIRWEGLTTAGPGGLLLLRLPAPSRADAPVLVSIRAERGAGRYELLALGAGPRSGAAVLARIEELGRAGRIPLALELAAGFARAVPGGSARTDVLLAAGKMAEAAAGATRRAGVGRYDRASHLLGAAVLEVEGTAVRYRAAFEAVAQGRGRLAEEAAARRVRLAAPCAGPDVAARAARFLAAHPESIFAPEVRLLRARGLEAAFWAGGGRDRRALALAIEAYRSVPEGPGAAEAKDRVARLSGKRPSRAGSRRACQ